MAKVNPTLMSKIKNLGAFDVTACYNCGECTAICPLVENGFEFPRIMIRYAILGLEDKLLSKPQLWLCYYCGDCSDSCPREADPGAFMMAARRYSIIKYSVGGIAKIFYSKVLSVVVMLILSIIAAIGIFALKGDLNLQTFDVYSLIDTATIHNLGLILAAFIGIIAFIQAMKMISYIRHSAIEGELGIGAKIRAFIVSFIKIIIGEGVLELNYQKCKDKKRFISHFLIFWGFVLLMAATSLNYLKESNLLGFRDQFEFLKAIDLTVFPTIAKILGIVGGAIVLCGSIYFIYMRIAKNDVYSEYSHISDWVFIILVFLAALTGFIIDLFIYANMPLYAYVSYAFHLIVVFDLLVTAPFTKFAHFGYRLIAVWFQEYQKLKVKK